MNNSRPGLFVTRDGKNVFLVFALVTTLFALWGLLNGMIDVMDKHFQDYLHLSKADSAWIQFAHYLGYFIMAMPAAYLAKTLGYKAGILVGLMLTAAGCFWMYPATQINQFWVILLGVCSIAMGLAFLETVANPYATVLGSPEFGATRINLAQSFNGLGWILGPIVCGYFIYAKQDIQIAQKQLYKPYAGIAVGILVLIALFLVARLPDLVGSDDAHIDEDEADPRKAYQDDRKVNRALSYLLMVLNAGVFIGIIAALAGFLMANVIHVGKPLVEPAAKIMLVIGKDSSFINEGNAPWVITWAATFAVTLITAVVLLPVAWKLRNSSIWSHPHFSSFTLAQFLYVAAQAGIFSFFINYIVEDIPAVGNSFEKSVYAKLVGGSDGIEIRQGENRINEQGATKLMSAAFLLFMIGRFCGSAVLSRASAHNTLGVYCAINALLMGAIVAKVGWLSLAALFASFFFLSIMFPTIFALGIYGLGTKAKMASSFIVMGITGGAMMPKLMGWIGDQYGMSKGFWVPGICFAIVALCAFCWPALSGAKSLTGVSTTRGH